MARTSTRGWKGCAMCKPHKDRCMGDAVRMPRSVLRQLGRKRRVNRRTIGDDE